MPYLAEARGPAGLRLYAIGDVHGRLDLLREVHARVEADLAAHPAPCWRVIHLGDYIDRGPESRGVVDHLIEYRRGGSAMCLAGNHDLYISAFLKRPLETGEEWLAQGGLATLESYGIDAAAPGLRYRSMRALRDAFEAALPKEHRDFFESLPFMERHGDFLFVHAGIRPGRPLERQRLDDLVLIRETFLADRRDHGAVVVHGHTISTQPAVRPNRIGLDTGAYASGRLTCLVVSGAEKAFLGPLGRTPLPLPC